MSEVTTWSQQLLEKSKTKHWATHIFFGDEPPADLYLIWCIKSWILHILRGHTIQHWRLPDPKSSTVNKQHNSWTILRPNPTQLKTVKTKKFKKKLRSLTLPEAQEEKKKKKKASPKNKTQHVSPSLSKQLEKLYSKEATPCSALWRPAPARRPQVQQRDASMYVQHPYYKYL